MHRYGEPLQTADKTPPSHRYDTYRYKRKQPSFSNVARSDHASCAASLSNLKLAQHSHIWPCSCSSSSSSSRCVGTTDMTATAGPRQKESSHFCGPHFVDAVTETLNPVVSNRCYDKTAASAGHVRNLCELCQPPSWPLWRRSPQPHRWCLTHV